MSMFSGFTFETVDDVLGSYEETKKVAAVDIVLFTPGRNSFYPLRSKCGSDVYRTVEDFDNSTCAHTPTDSCDLEDFDDLRHSSDDFTMAMWLSEAVDLFVLGRESDETETDYSETEEARETEEDPIRESRESVNRLSVRSLDFNEINITEAVAPDMDEDEAMFTLPAKDNGGLLKSQLAQLTCDLSHVEEDQEISELRKRLEDLNHKVNSLSADGESNDDGLIDFPSLPANDANLQKSQVAQIQKPRFSFRSMIAGTARKGLSYCLRKKKQNVCVRPNKSGSNFSLNSNNSQVNF